MELKYKQVSVFLKPYQEGKGISQIPSNSHILVTNLSLSYCSLSFTPDNTVYMLDSKSQPLFSFVILNQDNLLKSIVNWVVRRGIQSLLKEFLLNIMSRLNSFTFFEKAQYKFFFNHTSSRNHPDDNRLTCIEFLPSW